MKTRSVIPAKAGIQGSRNSPLGGEPNAGALDSRLRGNDGMNNNFLESLDA